MANRDPPEPIVIKLTVLGYDLTSRQNAILNYLVPAILGASLYIAHLAVEFGVIYSQYLEDNVAWASMTILFLYLPAIGCFIGTVSCWEMWPGHNCSVENWRWFGVKLVEHLFFPVWSIWRFAEQIFWSIEGVLAINDDDRDEALCNASAPRTVEFYFFLAGFLQTIPQIILQTNILMRSLHDLHIDTIQVCVVSIVLNITKMSITTTLYQRFKTQKIGGRDYPWFKPYKYQCADEEERLATPAEDAIDGTVKYRKRRPLSMLSMRSTIQKRDPNRRLSRIVYSTRDSLYRTYQQIESDRLISNVEERVRRETYERRSRATESRPVQQSGSDDDSGSEYLQPIGEVLHYDRVHSDVQQQISDSQEGETLEPEDEVDFPRALRFVNSLPEDDLAGKCVAFLWWFSFLTARFTALCTFFYFYPRDTIWVLVLHFLLCVGYLLYDVKSYIVRRTKAIFFLFIGVIYIFCIIEFKKKFKKSRIIYNAFFALVFTENLTMAAVWWNHVETTSKSDEWWLAFGFYLILGSSLIGVVCLLFYNFVNQPDKIQVGTEIIPNK